MILLIVIVFLTTGCTVGWFVHRAYTRIDTWGEAMNEQDADFRMVSEEEFDSALHRAHAVRFQGAAADPFRIGPAPAK